MKRSFAAQMGRATLGLAGAGAVSACSPGTPGAATDALADCYRSVQTALVAVQLAQGEVSISDRVVANQRLNDATITLLLAWAEREGLDLSRDDLLDETEAATDFLNGINAEAGLSGQALATEMTEASDHPELWQIKYDAALNCVSEAAS